MIVMTPAITQQARSEWKHGSFGLRPDASVCERVTTNKIIDVELNDVVAVDYCPPHIKNPLEQDEYDELKDTREFKYGKVCNILMFGTDVNTGASVAVRAHSFKPWTRLLFEDSVPKSDRARIQTDLIERLCGNVRNLKAASVGCEWKKMPKMYGFYLEKDETTERPQRKRFDILQLSFPTVSACRRCTWWLKKNKPSRTELTDEKTTPDIKAMCRNGINPADICRVSKFTAVEDASKVSNCQIEVECALDDISNAS